MHLQIYSLDSERGEIVEYAGLEALDSVNPEKHVWVDIEGYDAGVMSAVAKKFGLHELTIEDCLDPGHFPKLEDYGSYRFMILRSLEQIDFSEERGEEGEDDDKRYTRKIAIYLAENFIITFRKKEVGWLDALLRQVMQNPVQTLAFSTDRLAHRVIDVLIDRFLRRLGSFETVIDEKEDLALEDPDEFEVGDVLELKRTLNTLRRIMLDQRGVTARLANEPGLIREKFVRRYFKDVDDHALTTINVIDKQIDELTAIRDLYLAMANVRIGDTMRILAVITTIAAPINIVAGLYGMNFEIIPLLHNPHGFWMVVSSMVGLGIGLLFYFNRKHWI